MKTVEELVTVLHGWFDENGSEQELAECADSFMDLADAWAGAEPVGEQTIIRTHLFELRAELRQHSSDAMAEVYRSLNLLSEFCRHKRAAVASRRKGSIEAATRREQRAESAYNDLPKRWRW